MNEYDRINKFLPLIKGLYTTAKEKLGFKPHVKIVLVRDENNMSNPLGKTAHYSPSEHKVGLYTQGRHIKDILRSFAHELVHHNQNCRGDFDNGAATVDGYAQADGHLREMEREAYECGNMIFRDWEDNLKQKGGQPLFTSTDQNVRPMTTNVVSSRLAEGDKMKKNLKESQLRELIRGVIQEMFSDDIQEGGDDGYKDGVPATPTDLGRPTGEDPKLEEEQEEKPEEEQNENLEEQEEEEEVNESFFPKDRSIREKARKELNEALTKRWAKIIK
tara:strand:- start:2075 stop:2899 length:825 start_codon:yes stop_codon:yes gene_type:complete